MHQRCARSTIQTAVSGCFTHIQIKKCCFHLNKYHFVVRCSPSQLVIDTQQTLPQKTKKRKIYFYIPKSLKMFVATFLTAALVALICGASASSPSAYWYALDSDHSGKTILGASSGGIYVSNDYGASWESNLNCTYIGGAAVSGNGQHMALAANAFSPTCGAVIVSNDFGKTWKTASFPMRSYSLRGVSIDATGKYMAVVNYSNGNGQDDIYLSTDYGVSFHATKSDCIYLSSIEMGYNGQTIVTGQGTGIILASNDYGATFSVANGMSNSYYSLSCNSDCSVLLAGNFNGVSVSADSGKTWTVTTLPRGKNYKTAMNSSGQLQVAGSSNRSPVYISTDYGQTWTPTDTPNHQWYDVTSDATGQYLAAAAFGEEIYMSKDFGKTWST